MKKVLLGVLTAISLVQFLPAKEVPPETYESIRIRAARMGETDAGKAYEKRFSEVFAKPMQAALLECTKETKTPYTVNLVFVIDASGKAKYVVAASDQPVSMCVAKKLEGMQLPAPSTEGQLVEVSITIEH